MGVVRRGVSVFYVLHIAAKVIMVENEFRFILAPTLIT